MKPSEIISQIYIDNLRAYNGKRERLYQQIATGITCKMNLEHYITSYTKFQQITRNHKIYGRKHIAL